MPTKKKAELPEEMTTLLEAQESQTEENITASPAECAPDDACDTSLSQTETDSVEADASSAGIPDGALNEPTESQTEVKKPRRRKKAEPEPSQSDTEPENAPNAKEDGVDAAPKPKKKRTYTKPSVSVLSIDDRPTVETEADKAKNDLLDLIESQRSGRILTGTIQGVEQSADNPRHAFAVLYHGEFKVIIPAAEAVEPPEDYRGRDPDEMLHYMLTKRLGAEVDYIVKGIDPKSGIAAASRLEAMRARRKEMYFGTDRDGNNRIYAGVCAETRVVSAIRAGIFIDLFGVKFASPLSNSGRSFYKYFLVDSTNVEGRKTYKIRFHPKSVATPVLDGEVNIDSASYALRSARVKMAKGVNVNWIRHLAIEADNRLTADSLWFPQREKMTADFTLTKSDSSKMIAFLGSHEVTYSDVKFDTPIPKQVLGTSASVILSDDAISGKQVEWDSLRPYTLTQKEKAIYQMVDSIQQVPLYKNIYTVLNTIIGGYYNTKYVGIGPYSKVISFNRLEGARFQIGARTTKEFSRRVRLSTYLAYGTRDEDFKGAAEVELMLRRQLLRKLTVTYRNDAIQLSSGVSALSENNILSSIFSRGGTSRLSTIEEGIALYEHEWLHGISSSFELRGRHISSNRYVPMILPDGRSLHGINDASIRIGLRLSKDETIVRMPFEVRHMGSKYPIFSFDFTGAKRGVLPASYDYLRLEGRMQYRLNLPPVGYSRLMLEGGKIFGKVPYLLLKLHEGNGTYFYDRYAFSCMNFYEFSSDAWISFFYEHHFNGFLLGRVPLLKKLNWREVFVFKGVYGTLSARNDGSLPNTKAVMLFPVGMSSVEHPYLETGFGIENIFRLLRVDFIWRLTHHRPIPGLSIPTFTVNFSLNLKF